jgi:hypothetical protein
MVGQILASSVRNRVQNSGEVLVPRAYAVEKFLAWFLHVDDSVHGFIPFISLM